MTKTVINVMILVIIIMTVRIFMVRMIMMRIIMMRMIIARMMMNCRTHHWSEGVKYGQPPVSSNVICQFNLDKSVCGCFKIGRKKQGDKFKFIETLAGELACG